VSVATSDRELDLVARVRHLFDRARWHRRARTELWQRSYRLVHNRTWGPLRESWIPSPTASEIWPIVAALVGWMTDQRPAIHVVASMDPHSADANQFQQLARDLETVIQAGWITNGVDAQVEQVIWDAMVYGTGIFKVGWDMSLAGGLGDVIVTRVDPFRWYPDPAATCMAEANYFIEARTMSLQEMERRWPGSSSQVGGQLEDAGLDRRDDTLNMGRTPMANPGGVAGAPPLWGLPGQGRERTRTLDEGVTVYEAWLRENEHIENPDGETYVADSWRVVVVAGNQVIFEARAEELWGHGRHPYVRFLMHDHGEMWGISLVDHLAPLQLSLNRLLAAMQANAELTGNPVFVEDTRSGIARTQVTNRPGVRLTKNTGAEVGWLNPPQMSPQLIQLVGLYLQEMERVSGLSAIVRGATPTGRNAQGVLDAVQESAFVRVRLALRNLERALREVGELWASLVVENYTTPRMVAIVGPTGQQTSMALRARHFYVPSIKGEVPLRFSLWVQGGSTLPISRMARAQEADVLYAMGAIDRIALLEAHDYPNRDQIVQRITAAEAAGVFNPPNARQATRRTT
jgi:hypothetical protein